MWIMIAEVSAGLVAAGIGLAWILDRRARAAFERTLSPAEREEFNGFRQVARWRAFVRVLHLRQELGMVRELGMVGDPAPGPLPASGTTSCASG
jgi:hypothetical protein